VAATVRCAPPDNKPEPSERDACAPWLTAELTLVRDQVQVVVCLGGYAWQALWPQLRGIGYQPPRPRPAFGHQVEVTIERADGTGGRLAVLGCYHPSQQNTFTGVVTADMLDAVFGRARDIADSWTPDRG
jgi:uracil-DNA glycosylase family 4